MNKDINVNNHMNINNYIINNLIKIKVVPNSKKTELKEENNRLKLHLQAVPDKGKANQALVKFFKKEYNLNVEIKSGKTSREKILKIWE
ncbi:MAG: YggU family protein [Nanoarchaeota archaeon]|nr:YggU family protein [Nanoarchaeota archaeon]MBU1644664.1 YggU family protein [Nanoarchaeota archaeon]MBU1977071.1 YggU family protein [Nanoarchaeota archaeon]